MNEQWLHYPFSSAWELANTYLLPVKLYPIIICDVDISFISNKVSHCCQTTLISCQVQRSHLGNKKKQLFTKLAVI